MITRVIIKGGVGSGHRGHRGRPGKRGGSLPGTGGGIGVVDLTIADREILIQGVKSVGKELWSDAGSGFAWDDDNPFIGEMTPAAALAEWEDAGILEEATHGDDVYTEVDLVDEYGYSVSIDLATGDAIPFRGIQGYVETFVWKDVNDFYRDNPDRLLVNHNAAGHSITIFKPQSYDPDARDIAMVRSWYDQWGEHEATKEYTITKGGPGSGHRGHRGRPGKRGGSLPGTGGGAGKVWQGEQQDKPEEKLSKLKTGAIGEELAMKALEEKLGAKFSTLNNGVNNAPIDVGGNHHAVEVKTGLASNGRTAQHWRATIGQPGKKETELIKKMSKEEKRAHHTWKKQKILERKDTALREMEKVANAEIKPATVGVILSPDGKRGDVYFVPGFHLRLPWKDYAIDKYHIGTYDVGELKEYFKGGPGSGHRGHRGRPGKRGGSLPDGVSGSSVDSLPVLTHLNKLTLERGSHASSSPVFDDDFTVWTEIRPGVKVGSRSEGGFGLCGLHSLEACRQDDSMSMAVGVAFYHEDVERVLDFDSDKYWGLSAVGTVHVWNLDSEGRVVDSATGSRNAFKYYVGRVVPASTVSEFADDSEVISYAHNFINSKRSWDYDESAYEEWDSKNKEYTITKGGVGSGHRGHSGRPGKRGGSLPEGLDLTGFDVVESNIVIPSDVSEDWLIFNAYRPISGTLKASGGGTIWIDHNAPNGKHLAAIDPNDPLRDMWLKTNKRDQAVLLRVSKSSDV